MHLFRTHVCLFFSLCLSLSLFLPPSLPPSLPSYLFLLSLPASRENSHESRLQTMQQTPMFSSAEVDAAFAPPSCQGGSRRAGGIENSQGNLDKLTCKRAPPHVPSQAISHTPKHKGPSFFAQCHGFSLQAESAFCFYLCQELCSP